MDKEQKTDPNGQFEGRKFPAAEGNNWLPMLDFRLTRFYDGKVHGAIQLIGG
ncbi:MAG: hypothetical protein ACOYIR_02130 [Christensenellales bacterium]|jgi:hypothetical protein